MRHIKRYARLAGSSVHKERLISYLINRNMYENKVQEISSLNLSTLEYEGLFWSILRKS